MPLPPVCIPNHSATHLPLSFSSSHTFLPFSPLRRNLRCRFQNNSNEIKSITSSPDKNPNTPMTNTSNWQRWKKALGQRLNPAGVFWFTNVAMRDPQLAIPHVSVPDIRWIDWDALKKAGFRGVVFDKDNTLTEPYSLALWPSLEDSFHRCRSAFPGRIAILSNSAGLEEYDPNDSHAKTIEESIQGVHVIRHGTKKPAGNAEEIEKFVGCSASNIVLVGDRYFTDIVYGNRNGFFTIFSEPLTYYGEPFIVQQVRKWESYLVNSWYRKGIKPSTHSLISGIYQFVSTPPS